MTRALLPLTLLLAACPASVTAEGIEGGFGLGLGADYVRLVSDNGDSESIVLSTRGGVCEDYATFAEAQAEMLSASLDLFSNQYCANLEAPLADYVAATQDLFTVGARFVTLSAHGGDLDKEQYDLPDDASGTVALVEDTPYDGALDDFDPDAGAMEGCGLDQGELEAFATADFGTAWTLDGDFEITALEKDGPAAGTVDADMIDDDGDEDGAFTASFTATLCEIEL